MREKKQDALCMCVCPATTVSVRNIALNVFNWGGTQSAFLCPG